MFGGVTITELGSSLAGLMFIVASIQQFCPNMVHDLVRRLLEGIASLFRSKKIHITFYAFDGYYRTSDAYLAVEAYVGALCMNNLNKKAWRLKANKADKRSFSEKSLYFLVQDFEEINDEFEGAQFGWLAGKLLPDNKVISYTPWSEERRYFEVSCKSKYRNIITGKYLDYVIEEGERILRKRRTKMLYTNNPSEEWDNYDKGIWRKYVFEHPATFDNLAMDPAVKQDIIEDLISFTEARDYYVSIGRAWKRGYLLYGPPGTGKTTMVACMANLLGYDVYDLELTVIQNNSELRNLLISTSGKSIILIEDIDCTLPITAKRKTGRTKGSDDSDSESESGSDSDSDPDSSSTTNDNGKRKKSDKKKSKVTLSGLLNTIDGLWSPCSQERIIVFTTNHIDKLDPALIRAGRMDKHIEMSYCTFEAFKIFAKKYLNVETHPLFPRIHDLLSQINICPSDVAENLLPKSGNANPEKRLESLIRAIEAKAKG